MTNKLFSIILFTLVICPTCFGQSSFQGITPGTSTRDEVNRALGRPVNTDSRVLAEHTPPAGIKKLEVAYGRDSDVVTQMHIYFERPISRLALIQKLGLPQQADFKTIGDNKRLHEFFGGQALLIMTYESAVTDSGVGLLVYNRKETFDYVLKSNGGEVATALQNTTIESFSSWEKLEMCETAWKTYCDTWKSHGNSWNGWGVPLKITVNGSSVRVERSDRTGLKAIYAGTISGDKIQGNVDFCCDGNGNRSGSSR